MSYRLNILIVDIVLISSVAVAFVYTDGVGVLIGLTVSAACIAVALKKLQ